MLSQIDLVRVLSIFLVTSGSLLALGGSVGLLFWLLSYYQHPGDRARMRLASRLREHARRKQLLFGARREQLRQRRATLRRDRPPHR